MGERSCTQLVCLINGQSDTPIHMHDTVVRRRRHACGLSVTKDKEGGWSLLLPEKAPFSLRQEGKENVE